MAEKSSFEELNAWKENRSWEKLAEFVSCCLGNDSYDRHGHDGDNAWGEFLLELLDSEKAAKLWGLVFKRCSTLSSVEKYLAKKLQRDLIKHMTPQAVLGFRKRVCKILRKNRARLFCCELADASKTRPYYGLAKWESSLAVRGRFVGNWNEESITNEVKPHVPVQGKKKEERIANGCSLLLRSVQAYVAPTKLAKGLQERDLLRVSDVRQGDRGFSDKEKDNLQHDDEEKIDLDEEMLWSDFDQLFASLDERQREVARRYTFPKWVESEKSLTLHEVGRQLGVSHQTIDNDHKKVVAATKSCLEEFGFNNDLNEWRVFLEFLKRMLETPQG